MTNLFYYSINIIPKSAAKFSYDVIYLSLINNFLALNAVSSKKRTLICVLSFFITLSFDLLPFLFYSVDKRLHCTIFFQNNKMDISINCWILFGINKVLNRLRYFLFFWNMKTFIHL